MVVTIRFTAKIRVIPGTLGCLPAHDRAAVGGVHGRWRAGFLGVFLRVRCDLGRSVAVNWPPVHPEAPAGLAIGVIYPTGFFSPQNAVSCTYRVCHEVW